MLEYLKLQNVGPAEEMELELGSRLNILTGDNGLGKSFLLDVAWFVQTGCWPAEVNTKLSVGGPAIPNASSTNGLSFERNAETGQNFRYDFGYQYWETSTSAKWGSIPKNSLSVYLMADGSCSVYDPEKNESLPKLAMKPREKPSAYVFDKSQIWNGLKSNDDKWLCNGLIRDWASWQNKGGLAFETLKSVLEILSPNENDRIVPGDLTRVRLDDVRDVPTIKMPYDGEVAVVLASSGIRRILTLAYMIVWAWEEHKLACKLTRKETTKNVCIILDEIDAHLHPSWQRKIVPSILELTNVLPKEVNLQVITSTHSPLIMSSLEPIFDKEKDAWFDIDLVGQNGHRKVELVKRDFQITGDANDWLTSDAFDLESTGSIEAERVLMEVSEAMAAGNLNLEQAEVLHAKMLKAFPSDDPIFVRWNIVGKQKGWWK